ncbi:hypothetical protein MANES_14G101800v8 [Manihot esculenta]|uniref:Secreted protein n=1 Tax=Manihot esculenta TaxID=3983 RepID=A0A2C9UKK3_MANES|nr:hypothetical protein MANES_14G101800v8 [Manihot esculenta]
MSACFDLALIGALLKLCFIPSASSTLCVCCGSLCYMLLCCFQQSLHLGFPAISMRLRSKRTCSGVECFGGFHIKRFFYLFLYLRGALT